MAAAPMHQPVSPVAGAAHPAPRVPKGAEAFVHEISHVLSRHPELARVNRVIAAIDAGVRYPIAVAATQRDKTGILTYKVRKENLYQHVNQERQFLEQMKDDSKERVHEAEQQLGSSGTENAYAYERFMRGYFPDWLVVHQKLFQFYGRREIRNQRYHKTFAEQKLFDCHSERLFAMLGMKPNDKRRPGEVILVVENEMVIPWHAGRRPSRHSTFWTYFLRKVSCIHNMCTLRKRLVLFISIILCRHIMHTTPLFCNFSYECSMYIGTKRGRHPHDHDRVVLVTVLLFMRCACHARHEQAQASFLLCIRQVQEMGAQGYIGCHHSHDDCRLRGGRNARWRWIVRGIRDSAPA